MSAMFRSFSIFNYRVWFIGALVSNIGAWMQATAQSWVVLTELTDNDAAAMGITMALQFGPPLLLVGVTGWVADRFDRRKLLMITQGLLLVLGAALGVLMLAGVMTLPLMYAFALALGVIGAFDNPARQAFVSDVVSRENASNAVALNAASFNGARMIGPAVAGVLIVAVGTGWVFLLNAVTFFGMIVALLLIRPQRARPPRAHDRRVAPRRRLPLRRQAARPDGDVRDGVPARRLRHELPDLRLDHGDRVRAGRRRLRAAELDPRDRIARRRPAGRPARSGARIRIVVLGRCSASPLASVASALMPGYWSYAATLILIGFSVVTVMTTANGYVQTTTDPALRGRVLALYMAVIMGGTPIGAPIVGWVASEFGPRVGHPRRRDRRVRRVRDRRDVDARLRTPAPPPSKRFRITIDETRPLRVVSPEEYSDEVAGTTPIPLHQREGARSEQLRAREAG